ncbi:MAG TPA: type II/IV secretion system protein [Gemmatimonadaceae bacterium]|nr:type II/IV secretion system protein [Gemmatimonadaceae bacterium]
MSVRPLRDEWLLPTLESILAPEAFAQLRSAAQESYWESAVRRGMVSDDEILTALSTRFRMKIANLATVSQQARALVPEQLARKYRIVPLAISDSVLDIATADPHDLDCERTLAFATGREVRMSLATPTRIAERIDELYRPENVVDKILDSVASRYDVQAVDEAAEAAEMDVGVDRAGERPVIRLVDHVVAEGIASRASDIHLEPEEGGVAVRYRIDGVLREVMNLPRAVGLPLVSRIKIMSGLDIADRLRPQDGRARVVVNGTRIDLRVSTLPTSQGEKVVIRILDNRGTVLSLDHMGLNTDEVERIKQLLGAREGIILVTGPTGSGKTTTLYSMLRHLQTRGGNIVTVEDPVEYKMQGMVQVQVHEKAGLTFAAALRSILRQDPDVILVGEVRDRETAQIAVQSSLTGHLVLSTLHTIDAASSVTRLVDIGIESYKIAASLKGIVAQRLLRKLCKACRHLWMDSVPERIQKWIPSGTTLYRATGCSDCAQTGYRGRFAVTEVLIVTPEVGRRIAAGEPADRIADAAREAAMKSLWESGLAHVRQGETSLDELLRVLEVPVEDAPSRAGASTQAPQSPAADPRSVTTPVSSGYGGPRPRTRSSPIPSLPAEALQLREDLIESGAEGLDGEKLKVLLVEDEPQLRRLLREMLERDGFAVAEAEDGVRALDEVDRWAPDVVVLDLDLPRLDGYGVLTHLRARRATAQLPVLVLTANGDEDSEVRVFEYGANDFLSKPLRSRVLSARLRSLLKQARTGPVES